MKRALVALLVVVVVFGVPMLIAVAFNTLNEIREPENNGYTCTTEVVGPRTQGQGPDDLPDQATARLLETCTKDHGLLFGPSDRLP